MLSAMSTKLPCYCATLRQATRVISQKYDAAVREAHLTITQFTLLTALTEMSRPRVNDLAEALAMDQTTLSRTLKLMKRDGLIEAVPADDGRESRWVVSAPGRARMRRALPRWLAAQRSVEELLGADDAQHLASAAVNLSTRLVA
jgi:DNA-binding MarR family transcriptional regulator